MYNLTYKAPSDLAFHLVTDYVTTFYQVLMSVSRRLRCQNGKSEVKEEHLLCTTLRLPGKWGHYVCNAVTCLPEYTASRAQRRVTIKDECTLHFKAVVKGVTIQDIRFGNAVNLVYH